jgi:Nif-specific regulatory protein
MGRILVVDDHDSLRKGLVRALNNAGHDVEEAANGTAAIERLQDSQYDVVLTDLRMGGADGMDVLRTTRSLQPSAAVILMTAFGSIHTAVEAMKIGALDFVQKPFEIEEMELKIEKAIELRHLRHQVEYLRDEQQVIYDMDHIVGASGALQHVLSIVKKVARSNSTVLVHGETGTGKELIAGAIHHNSNRANRAFIKVNCAALQENLLESELFGHEKGAFTSADKQRIGRFEQADGGTLFLDEVGDMSPSTQAKILRVLQEHEFERLGGTRTLRVDVRVIAATNRNLTQMVQEGKFREDLYYRLNVVSVETPALRDRKDDIPALAQFFVKRFVGELKKKVEGLQADAEKLLMRHNWPGNIRELENVIERAVLLTDGTMISVGDLQIGDQSSPASGGDKALAVRIPPTGIPLEEIERQAVVEALRMSNWVQKDAAELLGISPRVMNYKIKILGIEIPRSRRVVAAPAEPVVSQ